MVLWLAVIVTGLRLSLLARRSSECPRRCACWASGSRSASPGARVEKTLLSTGVPSRVALRWRSVRTSVVARTSGRRMRMCALGCASPLLVVRVLLFKRRSSNLLLQSVQNRCSSAQSLCDARTPGRTLHTGLLTSPPTHDQLSRQSAQSQYSRDAFLLDGLLGVEHRHTKTKYG